VVDRLDEQRTQATVDLFQAHIAVGRVADVVAQLEELATADILQEAFTGQLMTALAARRPHGGGLGSLRTTAGTTR